MKSDEVPVNRILKPGDRVRLTGEFLRDTGQYAGPEGLARWKVMGCDCGMCVHGWSHQHQFVAVNEPHQDNSKRWRHIATLNLEKCP